MPLFRLGVSSTDGDSALMPTDLIRMADQNLFLAKNAGRNRTASGEGVLEASCKSA
jgi:PleD family two-component response regulator